MTREGLGDGGTMGLGDYGTWGLGDLESGRLRLGDEETWGLEDWEIRDTGYEIRENNDQSVSTLGTLVHSSAL